MLSGNDKYNEEDIDEVGASVQVIEPSSIQNSRINIAKRVCIFFILIMLVGTSIALFPKTQTNQQPVLEERKTNESKVEEQKNPSDSPMPREKVTLVNSTEFTTGKDQGLERMKQLFQAQMGERTKRKSPVNNEYIQWQQRKKDQLKKQYNPYPMADQRKLSFAIISGSSSSTTCVVMNAVDIFTHLSLHTVQSLVALGLAKVTVILDSNDQLSKGFLRDSFRGSATFVDVGMPDSDYAAFQPVIKDCQSMVYMQNYFTVNAELTLELARQLPEYSAAFSLNSYTGGAKKQLRDLSAIDLEGLTQREFAEYVFIFDARFLKFVTPLNLAYYSKYVLDEIIVMPVIAILQKSNRLAKISETIHSYDWPHVQFKEFSLTQKAANVKHLCFVAFPTDPTSVEPEKLKQYLNSLSVVKKEKTQFSLVIELPYSFNSQKSIWTSFKIFLKNNSQFENVRIRIWPRKAVSSLSVYESAYTYCPKFSTIVASRFNIDFHPNFHEKVSQSIEEKFHYYGPSFINSQNTTVAFENLEWSYAIRDDSRYFLSHFQHMQIFKSDLLKQHYMQILKCDQIQFYETQFSYTTPLLESVGLKLKPIPQTLFTVLPRNYTQLEETQAITIRHYQEWQVMKDNILRLKPYNSLQNIALRKNAPPRIPKKIHQIWFSEEDISPIQMRLHQTFKNNHPDYEVNLWTLANITQEKFPLTHTMIYTALEHEKFDNVSYKSAIADLAKVEVLYQFGGFYFDFNYESLRPLDPFRKYELVFNGMDFTNFYGKIEYFGATVGAEPRNYHLAFILSKIWNPDTFDLSDHHFNKLTGSYNYVPAFTQEEIYKVPGIGFQLLMPAPKTFRLQISSCQKVKAFSLDQQIFTVKSRQGRAYRYGIPCRAQPEAYTTMYWSMGEM